MRSTSKAKPEEMKKVLQVLRYHRGRKRPIARGDLAEQARLHDRVLRDALRRIDVTSAGAVVALSRGGYYLATTTAEVGTAIQRLQSRIDSLQQRLDGLERTRLRLERQEQLVVHGAAQRHLRATGDGWRLRA